MIILRQFDRQYRLIVGQYGSTAFEVGEASESQPTSLHIKFEVEKADVETPNSAKISIWNLNAQQLAALNQKDSIVTLKAGYGKNMPLIFVGAVYYVKTSADGPNRITEIEAIDGRIEIRDTVVSLSYDGKINRGKIIEDLATEMGIPYTPSYNLELGDLPNGFSFVGRAADALTKVCKSDGDVVWSIQNGVLQVKKKHDTISRNVIVLSPETGLIGIPQQVMLASEDKLARQGVGWDVQYLMNAAIAVNDYVRVESKVITGYYCVHSLTIEGDNLEGKWQCSARLLEV